MPGLNSADELRRARRNLEKRLAKRQCSDTGYVYILSNPASPRVVKIGYTLGDPKTRTDQLNGPSGVIGKFEVVQAWHLVDPFAWEQRIHLHLKRVRRDTNREHFNLGRTEAVDRISKFLVESGAWDGSPAILYSTALQKRAADAAAAVLAEKARREAEWARQRQIQEELKKLDEIKGECVKQTLSEFRNKLDAIANSVGFFRELFTKREIIEQEQANKLKPINTEMWDRYMRLMYNKLGRAYYPKHGHNRPFVRINGHNIVSDFGDSGFTLTLTYGNKYNYY